MKKETYYFSHDYNTRNDFKIKKMIMKLGYTAYGVYWALIEDLYNNDNKIVFDLELMAFDFRLDESIINSILNDFDLFTIQDGYLSSESIARRLELREEKSAKAKASAEKRWSKKSDSNANAMRNNANASNSNALKESKVKESKVKEIKDIKEIEDNHTHLNISNSDYDKFVKTYGKSVTDDYISRILNYEGNKKYKSLTMTLRNWIKKDGITAIPSDDCFKYRYEGKVYTIPAEQVSAFEKEKTLLGKYMKIIKTPENYAVSNN